jgi:4-hydroxyproline epimerase
VALTTTRRIQVIDSHTGGEPTRVVLAGWPDLGTGTLAVRRARFDAEHAALRDAVVREPRGHDAIVGALLVPPDDPAACTGVLFFNTVGTLGMCGHGTMGVIVTLVTSAASGPAASASIRPSASSRPSFATTAGSRCGTCPASGTRRA